MFFPVVATLLGTALATSIPDMRRAPAANAVMKYTGPVTPGGDNHTFYGNLNSVQRQIREINPDFNPDDFPHLVEAKKRVAKREQNDDGGKGAVNCHGFGYAYLERDLMIPALDSPGTCSIATAIAEGQPTCQQITCFSEGGQDNAMTLCNDQVYQNYDIPCHTLGEFGQDIVDGCASANEKRGFTSILVFTGGQEFASQGNWNVILGIPEGGCQNPDSRAVVLEPWRRLLKSGC